MLLVFGAVGMGCSGTDDPAGDVNQEETDAGEGDSDGGGEDLDAGEEEDDAVEGEPDAEDVVDDAVDEEDAVEDAVEEDVEEEPVEEPDGELCETAIDVTEGGILLGESLSGMEDNYVPTIGSGCPAQSFSGSDRVYVVSPAETTTYEFTVEPVNDLDAMIYVREDCTATECLDGTMLNSLVYEAPGGVETYIIVDQTAADFSDGLYDFAVVIQ